jgi:hypothetical protein
MSSCDLVGHYCPNCDRSFRWDGIEMLDRIRQSLQARLEGRNEGGDIEVMRLVDEIVEAEIASRIADCKLAVL